MLGELMTLPVRVTGFAVRTGLTLSFRAMAVASDVVKSVTDRGSNGASAWPAPEPPAPEPPAPEPPAPEQHTPEQSAPEPPAPESSAPEPPAPAPPASAPPAPAPRTPEPPSPPPVADEPVHVSEEPELVEEFAEPGAEDGAGAEVRVDEPWDGYAELTARDITARLSDASEAELAAVQLYESTHKQRETVLSAVVRELRIKTAPGSGS
jgi:hypothetical protein